MISSGRGCFCQFYKILADSARSRREWAAASHCGVLVLAALMLGGFPSPAWAHDAPVNETSATNAAAQEPTPSQGFTASSQETAKPVLKVVSDKLTYAHGDVMKVTVEVPQDGYLRLYGVSADGSTVLLFPNKWTQDDKVSKGTLTLPAADAAYDFLLVLDEGQTHVTESVHAVFSHEPFTDSGKGKIEFGTAKFEGVGITNPEQRKTRGLKPTAKVSASSVEAKYELNR